MTDQTESASEYAELLKRGVAVMRSTGGTPDNWIAEIVSDHRDAIRALEAEVLLRDQHIEMLRAENAHYLIGRDRLAGEEEVLKGLDRWASTGIARLTSDLTALRAERSTFDCRYAGQYWDASGSHCPLDRPCMRCGLERAEEELAQRREHMRREITPGRSTGGEG